MPPRFTRFIYTIFLLYIFGSLFQPLYFISKLLSTAVDIQILVIWTALFFLIPVIVRKLSKIIIGKGNLIDSNFTSKTINKKITKKTKNKTKRQMILFNNQLSSDLSKWHTISGQPQISNIRGKPTPPSLLLEEYSIDSRNTFITPNNINIKNGKISCDVYLEHDAVFNLVFRANNGFTEFYMARVDSRSGGSSGILLAKNSRSWGYIKQPNSYVLNDRWYHVELSIQDTKIQLKINSEIIVVEDSEILTSGSIGMFNEVKRVFVNNFVVTN